MRENYISVIVPCFNEEEVVEIFYKKIVEVFDRLTYAYDLIFVNDGSSDMTLKKIKSLCDTDSSVSYLSFSRNFGKEAAMLAGLKYAKGIYTVIMDADLQDPPELLIEMVNEMEKGEFDVIAARRISRKGEPVIRSMGARLFYKLMRKVTDVNIADGARDFRLMKRCVSDAIVEMPERNRFLKGMFEWVGFKTKWIEYENVERAAGETSWTFGGIVKYAIEGLINFSEIPLNIASGIGVIMTIISAFALVFLVLRRLIFGDPVAGWASIVCIMVFIGGVQLLCMGIIGKYIAKTYVEVKQRPYYIVAEEKLSH